MTYAEDQINRYSELIRSSFDEPLAVREVRTTITNCLIQQAIPEILTHDFDALLNSGNIVDISRMFDLCRQCIGGEDEVRAQFSKYMKTRGEQLITTCPDNELVTELLAFKKKINVISKLFSNNLNIIFVKTIFYSGWSFPYSKRSNQNETMSLRCI